MGRERVGAGERVVGRMNAEQERRNVSNGAVSVGVVPGQRGVGNDEASVGVVHGYRASVSLVGVSVRGSARGIVSLGDVVQVSIRF